MIEGWFDGVCEPRNPGGHAAWGALIKIDGSMIWQDSGYCGHGPAMSNNVAEYSGFLAVLKRASELHGMLIIRGDSKLVVMQINGRWKSRGGLYVPFYQKALLAWAQEVRRRESNVLLQWIPRDENSECDVLSKGVLKARGIKFRIQPE